MSEPQKFRKRPVVISAYQTVADAEIHTLEGTMKANKGDWIITGVKGEQYPCKPDIFEATYEPVDNAAAPPDPVIAAVRADRWRIRRELEKVLKRDGEWRASLLEVLSIVNGERGNE